MQATELLHKAKQYLPNLQEKRFLAAYTFAQKAHAGQKRRDGSDYITHPLAVAANLINFHVDEDTLIAALLHDVIEDTTYTTKDLEKNFGPTVAFLVEGVTKLKKVHYQHNMAQREVDSLKQLLLHSARDLRIILIKLCDRLHNMRTLDFIDKREKQLRISKETMEIYVPIANLLGIWSLKCELEDLCFKYIYPAEYRSLYDALGGTVKMRDELREETIKRCHKVLKKMPFQTQIAANHKTLYTRFKNITSTTENLDDLQQQISLHILVPNMEDCYTVLGVIHQTFKPKFGRITDYIAVPKANNYQSLHTTVFGVKGAITEFQIRTYAMHLNAEYGVAAAYFGNENNADKVLRTLNSHTAWLHKILRLQNEFSDNHDFLDHLKLDVFKNRIFVFTPKGKVIDLPEGATAIDFAYTIHSDVGNRAVKAEINAKTHSITTTLHTGDTINIITDPVQKGPDRDWLNFARTNLAINKIKTALRDESREQNLRAGRTLFAQYMERFDLGTIAQLSKQKTQKILTLFHIPSLDTFFALIGEGILSPKNAIRALYPIEKILGKAYKTVDKNAERTEKRSMLTASPLPLETMLKYRVPVRLLCMDRVGLIRDITNVLARLDINIQNFRTLFNAHSKIHTIDVIMEVNNFEHLDYAMNELCNISGVTMVFISRRKK